MMVSPFGLRYNEKAVAAGAQNERPRSGPAGEFRFRDSCSPAAVIVGGQLIV
jgi:hypothetical protein